MQFVRRALLVVVAPLLGLILLATAIDTGFVRIGTRPDNIKQILVDSRVYDSVVNGLLEQAGKVTSSGGDVSLDDPAIRTAAQKAFSPSFVRTNTETVIDSVYRWLDDKTPLPDFQIDLTAAKARFAENVAEAAQKRLASLPPCVAATTSAENFDAFKATCLPKGADPASEAAVIQNNIVSGGNFLDHPVITADSVKTAGSNKSVFADEIQNIPEGYQRAKQSPWVLGIITLLLVASIILLSDSKRKGLRRVGVILLIVGILLLLFAWGLNRAVSEQVAPKIDLNNKVLTDKLRTLTIEATKEIDKTYWIFGAAYTALGVITIAFTRFKNHGPPTPAVKTSSKGPTPPSSGLGPRAKTPPKKRSRTVKVQG